MKSIKVVLVCKVAILLFVFVAACGGKDESSDLVRINEQLLEEIVMLRQDFRYLVDEHINLQAELRNVQDYIASRSMASQSTNGEYQSDFDFGGSLDDTFFEDVVFEQLTWQNLGVSSAGMEYILWRGSWTNLAIIETHLNLLSAQGWDLVAMFQAGHAHAGGIVVVMRR